jgi:Zn-dependent M28 family amino/carboxypeptidase
MRLFELRIISVRNCSLSLISLAIAVITFGVPAFAQKSAERLREMTAAIAAGADSAGRRAAITGYLEKAGIEFHLEEFVDARMRKGTNIVAGFGGNRSKNVLLGAHYDRLAVGQGALDNAASCAILLELLTTFKSRPVTNYNITAVFFDLEEGGLSGSRAYFLPATPPRPLPTFALNMDIFGYGNAIFATASRPEGPLVTALQKAAAEFKIPVRLAPPAQYPSSDHTNMIAAGVETVGMSLLDAAEIDQVLDLLASRSRVFPPVLDTIHTPKDTMDVIRPGDMEKALPFLERLLRILESV